MNCWLANDLNCILSRLAFTPVRIGAMGLQPWEVETLILNAAVILAVLVLSRLIRRVVTPYPRWTIAHWMLATLVIGAVLALVVRPLMGL